MIAEKNGQVRGQSRPEAAFHELAHTPAVHFKLYFYAAVLQVIAQVFAAAGGPEDALEQFPFLGGYLDELAANGLDGLSLEESIPWWQAALESWEAVSQDRGATAHLPLRALRQAAGLDYAALTLLLATGLVEEDARFGALFESIQGIPGQHRPMAGLLVAWWESTRGSEAVRANLRQLQTLGLLQALNPDTPRPEWIFQVPGPLWDALRGECHSKPAPWAAYRPPESLMTYDQLILPEGLRPTLDMLPALLASGEVSTVIVRGPRHNGRRTLLGSMARTMGRGLLEIQTPPKVDDVYWSQIGPLATLLHAMPVLVLELGPGETAHLPGLAGYTGPAGIVLGQPGGLNGPWAGRALTLELEIPDVALRRRHWQAGFGAGQVAELERISRSFRMTSGHIRQAAELARSYAGLAGRHEPTLVDVQQASRALHRQALDTLAVRIEATGDMRQLAVGAETLQELAHLESRCRNRERLHEVVGPALGAQLNVGVRALFSGVSGTGKTLAARLLAATLGMDLYRVDLSAVVNKYIGETEKNLNQVFSLAEELDVILLLDEGDALLTQRTAVQSSNDRYANLETNYLLQRLEAYEGILIVTTNAGQHIDGAFQRRMDVVVDFKLPDVAERWRIWQLHLPPTHEVPGAYLQEVAGRCALTGGQIRNAVLHASLLALNDSGALVQTHLEAAVQREYRKTGAVCPLRRQASQAFIQG